MTLEVERQRRNIAQNRKAFYEYQITETIEAGIILQGTEIKSLREGKCNLQDSYAMFDDKTGELWVLGIHISPFAQASYNNHVATRPRKLLLHKRQLFKLLRSVQEKGFTLVPTAVYFLGQYVKVELGLAKGKKQYDKRHDIKERDVERSMRRNDE